MKVKIGNKIYDSEDEIILIILNEDDKKNITNMHKDAYKYCSFPDTTDLKIVKEFMKL